MRKLLAFIAIAMACICANAATPSYENFDPAYFVRSGNTLRVNITNISGPTNGITSSTATNIAAYQAQIATNGLSSGTSGAVTNNDIRDDLNLPYVDIGLTSTRNTNSIYLTGYLGGSTNTTLYRKAHLVYTNATSGLVFWDGAAISISGNLVVTNAAHNNLNSDYAAFNSPLGNFPSDLPLIAWEDSIGNPLSMQPQWTLGTNVAYISTFSADTFNPNRAARFGADVPSITDGNGFAADGSGIKISINTNSENYKVGLSIVNKYANLTEINIENQDGSGNRKGQLIMGPAANGTAFLGSPGLFRIIDPVSAFPHTDLFTLNRTNGTTFLTNPVVGGTITGNGSGLSNAVDLIASSNITIVTNANKRSFTISASAGAGSGTFDYSLLTNKPAPILLLATNQGSSLSNAFAIAAGDSSVTLVTNANGRLVTITSTGGTNGGGAAVVSNSVVTWTTGTWFTNSTAYYLVVNAPVILTTDNAGGNSGQMNFNVDTNLNGVTDWFLRSSVAVDSATTVLSTDIRYLGGIVPPNSAFQYQDVSINGTATMDGPMELTFLSTGSSGSGSGTFDYALLTNKPAPILLVATNQGSSLTNTVDLIAGDSSVVIVTNANKRSFTLTSTVKSGTLATNLLVDTLYGTNSAAGTNFAILDEGGSRINAVGITNGNLTIPGNIDVAGTFNVGQANVTNLSSVATGNTNRLPVWGPNGNLTNVSLVNLTLDTGVFPATLTATVGTNTTIASLGLPAMTAFSAHATIPGASLSVGGYGWNFRLTKPMKVYALGKYRITGNTNTVTLQIMRTNDCAVVAQTVLNTGVGDSNKFNYAMLATPVLLTTNFSYAITFQFESGATDATLGITTGTETITTADGIVPIYAVAPSVGCVGFSGWPSNAYGMVNFLSYPADEGNTGFRVTKVTDTTAGSIPSKYTSKITAPEASVNVSLLNSYNAPPYDVGRFLKRPWRSMDPFLDYYPGAPDVGAFTNTILLWKTNGMLAAGWDAVSLDDGWQSTTRTTTNTLIWDTAKFPLGLPWLVNFAHTNGFKIGTYFGWSTNNCLSAYPGSPYWTFKDPVTGRIVENQLSNDVYNAYVWGFDMLFYDNSCGPQSQSEEEVRAAIRIFNDATLKNGLQSGRTNRGMIIQMGGNAFGNNLTNSMMPYDVALGINLWTINGDENGLTSPSGDNTFYTKTKQTFEIPWFIQRGHYPTALLFNGSLPSASVRILLSSYVMAPLSILISTSSVTAGNLPYLTNSTWIRHYDDAATIPGRSVYTNNGRAEIWMRPFGKEVSETNLICFINANTTNNTLNFSNSFLGFDASRRLTFTEIFTGTNYYVTNGYWPYVQTPSNAVTFVVYPTPSVTNVIYPRMHTMGGTGVSTADPNSTTAAPHYFVESWSQTAANNVAYNGFHIEPDVREVTANYYSNSDLNDTVYWQDVWTTYYHSATVATRAGGVNYTTNIICTNQLVTFTSFNIPMPDTNAWKQLSWKPQASTNTSPRRWPHRLELIKWK